MNGANDGFSFLSSKLLKQSTDLLSLERVKSTRWLVEKNSRGVRDKLDGDGSTLAFTSGNTLFYSITDSALAYVTQGKILNDLVYQFLLRSNITLQFETSSEGKRLSDRESSKQYIILHDICCILLESLFVDRNLIVE